MRRRDFIKSAGCFVVSAGSGVLFGCGDDKKPSEGAPVTPGADGFPQGVASGDPRPTSVMLWTRVTGETDDDGAIALQFEIATDDQFEMLVASQELSATRAADHTLRVLVEDLEPDTVYYYRFTVGDVQSPVGRTWTAPEADADAAIHFAWASCQDYASGFYGAYRRMINDDRDAEPAEQLRFVLFVGDFIYETRAEGFQVAVDDQLKTVELKNLDGEPRNVPAFPSGEDMAPGTQFAKTVDDYRHLYKTFLSDPDLQAARARWPFINVWDDHEFSNDCWQTQANYTKQGSFDEPAQRRRVAANQAWFEFTPAILSDGEELDGIASPARDFEFAAVHDTPYDTPVEVTDEDNEQALATLTIYRRLRFGRHVDLVLTDNRAYRSDHALPEDVTAGDLLVFDPRAALSLEAVNAFDAGRTANDGEPEDMVAGFENTRKDSPPGTLLGEAQKAWWKQVLESSKATFKVWGNSLPLLRIRLDATNVDLFPGDLVLSADGWDGYPSERRELMQHLKDNDIRNVISLSGDHHAHFAGVVFDDYDIEKPAPVMLDFCAAGISSVSQFASVAGAIKGVLSPLTAALIAPVLQLITYDSKPLGGSDAAVVNLNTLIRYGSGSAMAAAASNDLEKIEAARKAEVNPHLRYADTAANGYGLAAFDAEGGRITLVTIERPIVDRGEDGAKVARRAQFDVGLIGSGDADEVELDEPELTGKKPFPLE